MKKQTFETIGWTVLIGLALALVFFTQFDKSSMYDDPYWCAHEIHCDADGYPCKDIISPKVDGNTHFCEQFMPPKEKR